MVDFLSLSCNSSKQCILKMQLPNGELFSQQAFSWLMVKLTVCLKQFNANTPFVTKVSFVALKSLLSN